MLTLDVFVGVIKYVDVMMGAGHELEFDGEKCHMNPADYKTRRRFSVDWPLDRRLLSQAHYSIGTCFYNIPHCITGEKYFPESIEVEVPEDSQMVEAAVLVVCIIVGFFGLVAGIIVIVMSKM